MTLSTELVRQLQQMFCKLWRDTRCDSENLSPRHFLHKVKALVMVQSATSFPRVKHFKMDRRTEENFMCLILPVFCNEALNRYDKVSSEWLFLPIQAGATLLQSRLEDGSIRLQLLPLSAGHQSDCSVSKTIMSLLLVNSMCDWFSQLLSCIWNLTTEGIRLYILSAGHF